MINAAIIYFREFLEISLIIGMITGATKDLSNRISYIISGITIGVLGSLLFAYGLNSISNIINDEIEDIFISIILGINVVMILYTIIWMQDHSKKLSNNIKTIDFNKRNYRLPFCTITSIIAFSIAREGIEIVLFTYGMIISTDMNILQIISSMIFGSLCGIAVGFVTYFTIIKLPIKHFFKFTTILLTLLAASLASQIPIYLESANVINFSPEPIWNSSWLINEQSLFGKILHSITGYSDRPSIMQFILYMATILIIYLTKNKSIFNNKL